jgi:hypothetical protein
MYAPAINYSLPAVFLTRKQCDKIEKQTIIAILPHMGINRHMPHEVVFEPSRIGGIGPTPTYVSKGKLHVMTALRQGQMAKGNLASTLKIAMDWTHKVSGLTKGPLSDTTTNMAHVPYG